MVRNHPTALLAKLKPLIERRDFADMAIKRYFDMPEVVQKSETQRNLQDMLIEDAVRTWVYRNLIEELKATEAYQDPGHFNKPGIDFVIEYLRKNRPELKEVKDDSGESKVH